MVELAAKSFVTERANLQLVWVRAKLTECMALKTEALQMYLWEHEQMKLVLLEDEDVEKKTHTHTKNMA